MYTRLYSATMEVLKECDHLISNLEKGCKEKKLEVTLETYHKQREIEHTKLMVKLVNCRI